MSAERDRVLIRIAGELGTANHARLTGNEGMVRVCARRAAGLAIRYWIELNHKQGWSSDAMGQLKTVALDESVPADVREAAERLTAKITAQFTSPFSTDPLLDSKAVITHFL